MRGPLRSGIERKCFTPSCSVDGRSSISDWWTSLEHLPWSHRVGDLSVLNIRPELEASTNTHARTHARIAKHTISDATWKCDRDSVWTARPRSFKIATRSEPYSSMPGSSSRRFQPWSAGSASRQSSNLPFANSSRSTHTDLGPVRHGGLPSGESRHRIGRSRRKITKWSSSHQGFGGTGNPHITNRELLSQTGS